MTKLAKRASARSRAEALTQRICRFIRNEGYDSFHKGDQKQISLVHASYERAIATINIMQGLSPSDRERLIENIMRAYGASKNGIKFGVMIAPINEANGALRQVSGQSIIVRRGKSKPKAPANPVSSQFEKRNSTGGRILRKIT